VIINYASYMRKNDDVVLSGLTASATNELFEVGFGGLITVTAAFVFLGATGAAGGTFGLGFNTLPVVFAHMGDFGRIIGFIWFIMLFLAAITSSLSMLQPVKAFLHEALGLPYERATAVLALITIPGSLWVIYFSKDLVALDTMDFWVGTVGIFLLATIQVICFGWIFGIDRGMAEAHRGAQMRIPAVYRFILKYVAPAYLLIVFVGFCVQQAPGYAEQIASNSTVRSTLLLVLFVFVLLTVATWHGAKRWRRIAEQGERV
jgi:SNF family Na+-dependent transporter